MPPAQPGQHQGVETVGSQEDNVCKVNYFKQQLGDMHTNIFTRDMERAALPGAGEADYQCPGCAPPG